MIKLRSRLVVALLLTALSLSSSMSFADPIIIGETLSIDSKVLAEERPLRVHLPASYEGGREPYPVLYVLDAGTRFLHTVGTVTALADATRMPEVIVVGVGNTDRTRDMVPSWTHDEPDEQWAQQIAAAGGADEFLGFLADELIPWVDQKYRAAPYRVLVGHSFGGLFAVHALATRPEVFDAHVAISPSLWWDEGKLVDDLAARLEEHPGDDFLYMSLGDEGGDMVAQYRRLDGLLKFHDPEGLRWRARYFPSESHGSVPMRSVEDSMEVLFERWQTPPDAFAEGLEPLEAHFSSLSEDFGYQMLPDEALVNRLGYQAMGEERLDDALALFRRNVELRPHSANVHDSLGEGLEASGKLEEAKASYHRAIERAREVGDPRLAAFEGHLEALEAQ